MPRKNFENIGTLQDYEYLKGIITDDPDTATDTCTVQVKVSGTDTDGDVIHQDVEFPDTPIFYHCSDDAAERENGAIEGAAAGFAKDDEVFVLKQRTGQEQKIFVIGHVEGIRSCETGGVVVFKLWDWTLSEYQYLFFSFKTDSILPILNPDGDPITQPFFLSELSKPWSLWVICNYNGLTSAASMSDLGASIPYAVTDGGNNNVENCLEYYACTEDPPVGTGLCVIGEEITEVWSTTTFTVDEGGASITITTVEDYTTWDLGPNYYWDPYYCDYSGGPAPDEGPRVERGFWPSLSKIVVPEGGSWIAPAETEWYYRVIESNKTYGGYAITHVPMSGLAADSRESSFTALSAPEFVNPHAGSRRHLWAGTDFAMYEKIFYLRGKSSALPYNYYMNAHGTFYYLRKREDDLFYWDDFYDKGVTDDALYTLYGTTKAAVEADGVLHPDDADFLYRFGVRVMYVFGNDL